MRKSSLHLSKALFNSSSLVAKLFLTGIVKKKKKRRNTAEVAFFLRPMRQLSKTFNHGAALVSADAAPPISVEINSQRSLESLRSNRVIPSHRQRKPVKKKNNTYMPQARVRSCTKNVMKGISMAECVSTSQPKALAVKACTAEPRRSWV